MITFTYNWTKRAAERIVTLEPFTAVYLQAVQLREQNGQKKITVPGMNDFNQFAFNDRDKLVGYFRDVDEMAMVPLDTDICYRDYMATQRVRFVCYAEHLTTDNQQLVMAILNQLTGNPIVNLNFDMQSVIESEYEALALSADTFCFSVDIDVTDTIQLDNCPPVLDCVSYYDLKICKKEVEAN